MDIIERILVDVTVIGEITTGKRLDTSGEFINIEEESMTLGFRRTVNRESRKKTMRIITMRIETSILISNLMMEVAGMANQERSDELMKIIRKTHFALYNSVNGLSAIKATYEGDAAIGAQIETLINRVRAHIEHMERKIGCNV